MLKLFLKKFSSFFFFKPDQINFTESLASKPAVVPFISKRYFFRFVMDCKSMKTSAMG